jgi:molybdopterin synthase sulfur carrier subunit
MAIHIRYFASLREQLGRAEDQVEPLPGLTVAGLWSYLWPDKPIPPNTLIAVNMEYKDRHYLVQNGDEVAFFPPITGG